jgi:hypothetical protein
MSAANTEAMILKATVESIGSWYIHRSPIVIIVFLGPRGRRKAASLPVRRGVGNAGNLKETMKVKHLKLDTCKPKSEEII